MSDDRGPLSERTGASRTQILDPATGKVIDPVYNMTHDYITRKVMDRKPHSSVTFVTKDSGERKEYDTGAQRDKSEGKGRFDLLPAYSIKRLAQLFERGAVKYEPANWTKGIPLWRYLDSGIRHYFDFLGGDRSEDHLAAVAWNVLCYIWTENEIAEGRLPQSLAEEKK